MLGAIVGDFAGSVYEFEGMKRKDFRLPHPDSRDTDDSLLTIAVAEWLLHETDLVTAFHKMVDRHPDAGWGNAFYDWAAARRLEPYNSYGNGAGMRVSPVGWAFETLEETLHVAARTAEVTHNHPEGIKGAHATAATVFLARTTRDRDLIRGEISRRFGYDLDRTTDQIRPAYHFNETCQRTVPEAIVAFLDSESYEDAIRNAISLGGDADTLACICGGIAHAFYGGVPAGLADAALESLGELRGVWQEFRERFSVPA